MGNTSGFAASSAMAFIRSPGKARGQFAAGVKTVHYCAPLLGFGNTIDPVTGAISTNAQITWTYTKKTVTTSWTYSLGDFVSSTVSLNTQQQNVIATNIASGNLPDQAYGVGDTYYMDDATYTVKDFDSPTSPDYVAPPTPPAAVASSGGLTTTNQYYPWYDISGTTLTVHSASSSTGSLASKPFTYTSAVYGDWTNMPTSLGQFFGPPPPVTFPNSVSGPTISVSGGTVTSSFSANLWSKVSSGAVVGYFPDPPYGEGAEGALDISFNEQASETIATTYSDPIALSDLEVLADAALATIKLTDVNQRYCCFESPLVLITWNSPPGLYVWVERATYTGGTLGSYSELVQISGNSFIDTSAVFGTTYSYRVTYVFGGSPSAAVTITPLALSPPYFESAPTPITTVLPYGSPPSGVQVMQIGQAMQWTTISLAENANQQIVLFPTDGSGGFVISQDVTCGSPLPFFLAARGMPYSQSPLSIPYAPAHSYVWSKSRGYLPGNSPHHSPPTTNIMQKFWYTPASFLGTGAVNETANFPPLTFPHGRSGNYAWQLTQELPSSKEAFMPGDVPAWGYLWYD